MPRKKTSSSKKNNGKKEKDNFLEIIKEHELVPKARVLNEEEVKDLLNKYNLKSKEQLPKIFEKDPLVKICGAKKGDVLEIIRKSPTTKEAYYYRLVI